MKHRLTLPLVAAPLLALLPTAPAQASWEEVRCAVAIPAAQAGSAAARISLRAAEAALPGAARRLEEARARLKKATAAHQALLDRLAANPGDATIAEQVERSNAALSTRKAAVASASAVLSTAKLAVPKARSAAETAERKLKELKAACPK